MKRESTIVGEKETNNLEDEGLTIFIPSNIFYLYSRLEVSLGLKLCENTDNLKEASYLLDEI